MTEIMDIPESGIYLQRGAIAQLVAQLIDVNTGLPVLLQAATSLFIDILYPDRKGIRTFTAELYTDGSDGKISYITQNAGLGYSDLNQVGLYGIQGRASIGDVPLPSSYMTDFYVSGNAFDQATLPPVYPILKANDGTYWQIYILQGGQLDILQTTVTLGAVDAIYLVDSTGQYWSVVAQRNSTEDAHLETAQVTGPFAASQQFYLADTVRKQWVVNVRAAGNTTTK